MNRDTESTSQIETPTQPCHAARTTSTSFARAVVVALLALATLTATPTSAEALLNPGNIGLPPRNPGIDPGNPTPPPPPPPPPPLAIRAYGLGFIEIVVRPPAGATSELTRQAPGDTYAAFKPVAAGTEQVIRDENLRLGREYCYRLTILGSSAGPEQTHTRCATTDWRLGFERAGIDPDESARVLSTFDWSDTQRIAPGSEDEPALYHMNVLVEGADPLAEQGLRSLGMHVQPQPIFVQELDDWDASQSVAQECTGSIDVFAPLAAAARFPAPGLPVYSCVPVGRWLFAVVPGNVYNEIRERMLEQIGRGEQPGLRALVFRRVPVAEALPVGVSRHVLDYQYLGQQGFEFNAISRCSTLPDGTRVCETRQELVGWILRKVVKWVVELGDLVIEKVRSAIGRIARLVKGELRLDLNFRILNTDAGFGTDQVLRSGWSGEQIHLAGVKIEVRQGLAAFYAHTDSQGYVTLKVAKNADTKVCIQVENDTAELTEYLIETTVCVRNLGKLSDYTRATVDVRHPYVNTLAAMTDARRYLLRTAGIQMPKVTVLVGRQADSLAAAGRSFAPCMGRVPSALGLGADIIGALGAMVNPAFLVATITTEFLYSVDIVLRTPDDDSRGVPVHEYGHVVMCEMLQRQGFDAFQMAWTDVIFASGDQSAGSQASYLNEAFADFFTAQVVGGTNYFAPSDAVASKEVNYCKAGAACFDENFSGKSDFEQQVARITSILHDAFDGNPQGLGPNDASHWTRPAGGVLTHVAARDSDLNDETVRLPGAALLDLFDQWDDRGQLLREDSFLGGLADAMKAHGVPEADRCALFALHDGGAACPDFVVRRAWLDWLDDGIGVQGTLDAFAELDPPAAVPGATRARDVRLVGAIADVDPRAFVDPAAPCEECSRPVVLDGKQRVRVAGLGKKSLDTAFALRIGDGSFKGVDPLGRVFAGTWSALDADGTRLRLRPDAEATQRLLGLLAESVASLGLDPATVRTAGKTKITLRVADDGTLAGKVTMRFKVDANGQTVRGTYVATLRGA
ncbi:MAG: hypothetical protein FJ148_10870 [Deltaproteobacteria bacterium]|nr:hypothetical protein [Deltaproteobacteria bacterium]